jgi:trehalose 6-phosphate phosphatase
VTPRRPLPDAKRAWFLDLDGTLVAIARSPGGVRVKAARHLMEDLHQSAGGAVAVITGRALADLDRLFPGISLAAAGQHGIERRRASGRVTVQGPPRRRLDQARHILAKAAAAHPRLLVEDKGLSLALHYRGAPRLAGLAHRVARRAAAQLGDRYCMQSGKRVIEIRPAGLDKGKAVLAFMRERPFRGRTPVFLGDDATDEYAFAVVNRLGGLSIKVGPGPTGARWRLSDVATVRRWLRSGRPPLVAVRS